MVRRTGRTARRRLRVALGRGAARGADALARRPKLRAATVWGLAGAVNAALLVLLSFVPDEALPDAPPGTPIEIVYLELEPTEGMAGGALPDAEDAPPASEAAPVSPPTLAPEPVPAPRPAPRGPAVDLPDTEATGTPGIVALDCLRTFEDEARATACAGGRVVGGWQAEVEGLEDDWMRIAERVGQARRSLQEPPPLVDPAAAARYGGQAAARRAGFEREDAPLPSLLTGVREVGADGREMAGADSRMPGSILTSYGDRKAAEEERRIREDGRILRELGAED